MSLMGYFLNSGLVDVWKILIRISLLSLLSEFESSQQENRPYRIMIVANRTGFALFLNSEQ